jgi:3-dehydroquinate dehydratase
MRDKPYAEHKTALTPAEKLRVAVAVLVDGMDQHRVAALMGVNPGRVAEAVVAIRDAIENVSTDQQGPGQG